MQRSENRFADSTQPRNGELFKERNASRRDGFAIGMHAVRLRTLREVRPWRLRFHLAQASQITMQSTPELFDLDAIKAKTSIRSASQRFFRSSKIQMLQWKLLRRWWRLG
jgi:hypothetical protein